MNTEQQTPELRYKCEKHGVWNAHLASACPECMVMARREITQLRIVAKALAGALDDVTYECNTVHHNVSERHERGQPCPVIERIDVAIAKYKGLQL